MITTKLKPFLLFSLTLLLTLSLDSQSQIITSFSYNTNIIQPGSHEGYATYDINRNSHISDTTWVAENYTVENFYASTYTHVGGANLKVQFSRAIGKNLMLTSGIGINYTEINVQRNIEVTRKLNKTVDFNAPAPLPSVLPNTYNHPCDFFANQWGDIDLMPGHNIRNYSIVIPLDLEYHFKNSGFSVTAGLYLNTPLVSDNLDDIRDFNMEHRGDDVVCTYFRRETIDRSGQHIRNAQLGAKLALQYLFKNGLAINAGYLSDFTDLYVDAEYQASPTWVGSAHSFTPKRLSLGLRYFLVKTSEEERPELF